MDEKWSEDFPSAQSRRVRGRRLDHEYIRLALQRCRSQLFRVTGFKLGALSIVESSVTWAGKPHRTAGPSRAKEHKTYLVSSHSVASLRPILRRSPAMHGGS
ncbi:hypothetical protein PISMIDRAFT_688224 [Pisolithus microcarpus 441]|uniref:Uncharacterized protein n=1 Tax=Pisolithus microcarpus 441 TaxID=765257 RepID=A0A0C9YBC6_9AGAM|nr:hypothetical protein PISMIDRAFT_688224 [Pisolithus microcarpus 441]